MTLISLFLALALSVLALLLLSFWVVVMPVLRAAGSADEDREQMAVLRRRRQPSRLHTEVA
ncbi:MAG: hypothetical protein VW625_03305 [Perlucidibaca sp.]